MALLTGVPRGRAVLRHVEVELQARWVEPAAGEAPVLEVDAEVEGRKKWIMANAKKAELDL